MSWMDSLHALAGQEPRLLDFGATVIPDTMAGADSLARWLDAGKHAEMQWMQTHAELRKHPKQLWPGMRTVVLFLWKYPASLEPLVDSERVRIAAYAQGEDYHRTLGSWLSRIVQELKLGHPGFDATVFVDSHPVLEREFAVLSGLGWIGKNSLLLNQKFGSAFVLGGFACNQDMPAELGRDIAADFCGRCSRCVESCPTQAIDACKEVDSRRCISYLTIEKKGDFASGTPSTESWLFGCDICQSVCPWNKKHLASKTESFWPTNIAEWDALLIPGNGLKSKIQGTPLDRTGRKGLRRNLDHLLAFRKSAGSQDPDVLPD